MESRMAAWRLLVAAISLSVAAYAFGAETTVPAARRRPLSQLPVEARIAVPRGPAWLEIGFDSVWVTKIKSRLVLRIDPKTNQVVARIPVGSNPELGIGIGFGSAWVPDTKDRTITQIDPIANRVLRVIPVDLPDDTEGSIGVGEGAIWVMTNSGGTDSGTLSRIDPVSGSVVATIPVHPKSHAVVVGFGAVWITSTGDGVVTRVDPKTNAVVAEIAVRPGPRFLAAGEGGIWVLSQGDGSLSRIDPSTNTVIATLALGVPGDGGDLSIDAHYVWISAEGTPLTQVDPVTNTVVRQYYGGKRLDTLRVGFGAAWLVDERHGQIWRVPTAPLTMDRKELR